MGTPTSKLLLLPVSLLLVAGCGTTAAPLRGAAMSGAGPSSALSSETLRKGFAQIHRAVFGRLDADHNKVVDEYEAGNTISLRDFQDADANHNHKLTYVEFKTWSTHQFLWFHDNKNDFMARMRSDLGGVFRRLDTNHDGLLTKDELSRRDMAKLKLSFDYARLNLHIPIKKIPADKFTAADRTKDGKLSPAEFEDLYLQAVIDAIDPAHNEPAPAPGEDPNPPVPGGDEPSAPDAPGDGPAAPDPGASPGGAPDPNSDAPPPPPTKQRRR